MHQTAKFIISISFCWITFELIFILFTDKQCENISKVVTSDLRKIGNEYCHCLLCSEIFFWPSILHCLNCIYVVWRMHCFTSPNHNDDAQKKYPYICWSSSYWFWHQKATGVFMIKGCSVPSKTCFSLVNSFLNRLNGGIYHWTLSNCSQWPVHFRSTLHLTRFCQVDYSILVNWMSSFPILRVSDNCMYTYIFKIFWKKLLPVYSDQMPGFVGVWSGCTLFSKVLLMTH